MAKYLVWLCVLLGGAHPFTVGAETCKYIDGEGNAFYSNYAARNAKKVICFDPTPEYRPPPQPEDRNAKSNTTKKKAARGFPNVDGDTQRDRDSRRRKILEEELADEQRLLDRARQTLNADPAARDLSALRSLGMNTDRLQPMLEAVDLHQRNIDAIENELKRVR